LTTLGLQQDASQQAALAALNAHRRLGAALALQQETKQRVQRLERTATDLESLASDLIAAHAPDLIGRHTLDAAHDLLGRWRRNAQASAEATRLDETLAALRTQLAREREEQTRLGIAAQQASAGLEDASPTGARTRLMSIEPELEEIGHRIDSAQRNVWGLEAGFADNMKASLAAATASEAEETLARVEDLAQRFAQLKLASAVLTREIERFRAANQAPVLARASEHFAFLTRGRYAGLREGFGVDDEPVLRAMRSTKGDVGVEALSDGTRDALYLALRLASWEHLATTNPPLPVVLDDVLIHFDDERATAALELLGKVAAGMQIVLFTHHGKIVERARTALGPALHVSELSSRGA
jgi:uncharacterized protein YhaN